MAKAKGIGTPHFDDEEKAVKVEAICELYETQHCTLESCCEAVGISARTFFLWKGKNSEFAERFKKAKSKQQEHYWEDIIQPLAETALQRLLSGERKIETKEEGEHKGDVFIVKKKTTTETEILPNATVTIFTMKGIHPQRFVDRTEITGKDGGPVEVSYYILPDGTKVEF